jgi:hypothetical protein
VWVRSRELDRVPSGFADRLVPLVNGRERYTVIAAIFGGSQMKTWHWAGYVVVALIFYYAGMKGYLSAVTSKLGVS